MAWAPSWPSCAGSAPTHAALSHCHHPHLWHSGLRLGCARKEIAGLGCGGSQIRAPPAVQAAAVSQRCGQSLVGQDPGCNFGWGVGSSSAPLMQLQWGWDSILVFFSAHLSQQGMCPPGDLILSLGMKKATEIFAAIFEMPASIPVCKRDLQMGLPLQQTWRRVSVSGLCATTATMRQHCLFQKNKAALWLNELKSYKNK